METVTDTCNCGARLVPSVRYDQDGPHETLACFRGAPECTGEKLMQRSVEVTCPCGTTFKMTPSALARGRGKHCSSECRYLDNDTRVDVTCPCGTAFKVPPSQFKRGRGKYCSEACSKHARMMAALMRRPAVECPCGKLFLALAYRVKAGQSKYCSVRCRNTFMVRHTASVRMAS